MSDQRIGEVVLRFYEELNDFLPEERRKASFSHRFRGTPAVEDVVESLGSLTPRSMSSSSTASRWVSGTG